MRLNSKIAKLVLMMIFMFNYASADNVKNALDTFMTGDSSLAMVLFEQECSKNNFVACTRLGIMYEFGDNATPNDEKAKLYYDKACRGKDESGCMSLKTIGNNIKFDYTKIKNYASIFKNDEFAIALDLYFIGDVDSAKEKFTKMCKNNNMPACARLGIIYDDESNYEISDKYYKTACDANDKIGCGYLAIVYEDNAKNGDKNYEKTIETYEKACTLGDIVSCYNLGYFYETNEDVGGDFNQAIKYYEIACNNNHAWACGNLGYLYDYGKGIKKDAKKAYELYKKSCDMKNAIACTNLGIFYEDGIGLRKNLKLANEYYQKACEYGDSPSCK